MNEHAQPQYQCRNSADELEEEKMHELERIITQVDHRAILMDGKVEMDTSPDMRAKHPGAILPDGRRPASAADAREADAGRLFPPSFRLAPRTCCRAPRTR